MKYNRLKAFFKDGPRPIPTSLIRYRDLAAWAGAQRKKDRKGNLHPLFRRLLNDIEFEWNPVADHWGKKFEIYAKGMKRRKDKCQEEHLPEVIISWAEKQRLRLQWGHMSVQEEQHLNDIGFVWNRRHEFWNRSYAQLVAFVTKNGHCTPSLSKHRKLYIWVTSQRNQRKEGRLTDDQIVLLNSIGMSWKVLEERFEETIIKLNEFIEEHEHSRVPNSYSAFLFSWVANQRAKKRAGILSMAHQKALTAIGFDWNPGEAWKRMQDEAWEKHMKVIRVWYRRHGDLPRMIGKAGTSHNRAVGYLQTLRVRARRKSDEDIYILTALRRRELNTMGMAWEGRFEDVWTQRIKELRTFRKVHGHTRVPRGVPAYAALAKWTSHIRSRPEQIGAERLQQLMDLGFTMNSKEEVWDIRFKEFARQRDQHGDSWMPPPGTQLGRWIIKQRTEYNKGKLKKERVGMLDSKRFSWNPHGESRAEYVERLLAFKKRFGHVLVPSRWSEDVGLAQWVANCRAGYTKGTLAKETITKLNAMGFQWRLRTKKKSSTDKKNK
ncbi:MAG: helicase associated domain-containing protein [bacterium]|nr:helicase associated domain-containing protein [bacterium]